MTGYGALKLPPAGAAVLRAARMRAARVKLPSDLAIGLRKLVGTVRGLCGNGITKAVMDVSGPQARGE